MFKGMKKIISVVMAAAMAVTTIAPSASITANAADKTLKSVLSNTKSDSKIASNKVNKLSDNLNDVTPTTTHLETSGEAVTWAKRYIAGKSGKQLTIIGANTFKENVTYTVTYPGIKLDGSGKTHDLKIAIEGYHPFETYSKTCYIAVTKDDIDSWQGLEIKSPNKLQEAWLGEKLSNSYPSGRAEKSGSASSLVTANTVICKDAVNNETVNKKDYQLITRVKFGTSSNSFKIRYYTGGADEDSWQGTTQSEGTDKYASEPVFLGFGNGSNGSITDRITFSASKTVNNATSATLKNASETFTYRVKTSENGSAVGDVTKKYVIKDTMEKVLEPSGGVKQEAELSIDKVVDKYEHKVGDDVKFT